MKTYKVSVSMLVMLIALATTSIACNTPVPLRSQTDASLRTSISTNKKLSWQKVKEYIYTRLDNHGGKVRAVYSGTVIKLEEKNGKLWPPAEAHIHIEHTWPAQAPWGPIGRDTLAGCDLHHLYPTRAGLNMKRSNHPFGEPVGDKVEDLRVKDNGYLDREGGGTPTGSQFGLDAKGKKVFKPRADHRGNAARAMFYVSFRYNRPIPDDMEGVLRKWHRQDPVDRYERERTNGIERIQGNRNPFVVNPGLVAKIKDF